MESAPNGDPWGYSEPFVENRLDRSINFVISCNKNASSAILEIGCFQGQFTNRLSQSLPKSKILAVDVSPKAVTAARKNGKNLVGKVEYSVCDVRNIEKIFSFEFFDVILILEVLYYLEDEEIESLLAKLLSKYPRASVIVSAPDSMDYITKVKMKELFRKHGFKMKNSQVVSMHGANPWQIIYEFKKDKLSFRCKR